ncbi:CmcJ/NvfI family oxidoreductase [Dongia sedimenti]|uniref:CmcJ/NvfI family oxidoreductase n=1 Tax=Dongia sedimenti TaxID=3064282 RepID=A0ABU0YQ84_9PROT|nr:CmcJ/NvfI family oxidoreductase [Rhodospirillaceae bacterium R-7]
MLQQKSGTSVQSAESSRTGVEAELSFILADGRKPFSHQYDPPPGQPVRSHQYENRRVFIQDGRPVADAFAIDREGFALVPHATQVADLYDEAELREHYYPETEALLKAETGASKVLIFDHTIRTSHQRPRGVGLPREAVLRVHNDYTLKSGPQRVRDLLPKEAEARLQKRFAIVNVWRPIVGPLQQFPLALGDAASLAADDIIATDLIYPDRVGEIYSIAHNPAQRWFYFPEMRRDEVVLLKTYDSDPARARFSAHSAFADPNFPDPKVLRESIEIRALVFW